MTKKLPAIKKGKKPVINDDDLAHDQYLTKGKYDIDYAIGICKMVLDHCEQHKFAGAGQLQISLKYSLDKLIKFLKSEKQPRCKDPVILWTCPKCKESDLIFASKAKDYTCGYCIYGKDVEFTGIEKL